MMHQHLKLLENFCQPWFTRIPVKSKNPVQLLKPFYMIDRISCMRRDIYLSFLNEANEGFYGSLSGYYDTAC